jgi:hypothetical protein
MLRIVRKLLHPITQLPRMNAEVFCGLRTLLDQSNSLKLKLELAGKTAAPSHTPAP